MFALYFGDDDATIMHKLFLLALSELLDFPPLLRGLGLSGKTGHLSTVRRRSVCLLHQVISMCSAPQGHMMR